MSYILVFGRRVVDSVTLGSVTQGTLQSEHVYEALKVDKHEGFVDRSIPLDDIAIVTLKTNVKFTSSIYHICLPKYKETFLGQSAVVAGKMRSHLYI